MDEKNTSEDNDIKKLISFNWKKIYGIIVEFSSTNSGKAIVTGAVLFIAYLFYQFGYGFLYGYYFGGKNTAASPLVGMINQIPFNFKYIVIIGIVLLAILFLIFWSSYQIIMEIKTTSIMPPFVIIIILIIFMAICTLLSFLEGKLELDMETANNNLYNIVFQLFYVIFILVSASTCYICFFEKIRSVLIFIFTNSLYFVLIQLIRLKITSSNPAVWLFFLFIMYMGEIYLLKIYIFISAKIILTINHIMKFSRKYNKQINILYVFIIMISFFLYKILNEKIFLSVSIILLCISIYKLYKRSAFLKEDKKESKPQNVISNINKTERQIVGYLLLFILFVVGYFALYIATYKMGQYCGTINKTQYSTINIINQENLSFEGIVVRQEGTTYYISNKDRELVIITSNQIAILP